MSAIGRAGNRLRVEPYSFDVVLRTVAKAHKVKADAILGRRRDKRTAEARLALYYALREVGLSWPAIGALLGRDHTTVMVGARKWAGVVGDIAMVEGRA